MQGRTKASDMNTPPHRWSILCALHKCATRKSVKRADLFVLAAGTTNLKKMC